MERLLEMFAVFFEIELMYGRDHYDSRERENLIGGKVMVS